MVPVRKLVVAAAGVVAALGAVGVPAVAEAAPTPVTVKVIGAQTYGGQPAFSGSTGTAGLTVSGVTCTGLTSGAAIAPTLPALGSYAIAGSTCSGGQLSNPDYVIAGYQGGSHTVFRAPLTVTADDKAKDYGDANPALTHTVTGFVNGQDGSVLTGAPALSTTATTSSNAGTYPISITKGTLAVPSNNYFLNFAAGTLTVRPKPLTVSVTGAQEYGIDPLFVASSGVAGVTVKDVTCTGLTSGQAIARTLPVGAYTIDGASCSGGVPSSGNYAVGSYRGGRFSVLKAALTVTATDATRDYGTPNPAFDYSITGFRNGDDASAVTGAPELSTTATSTSDVGSYPITPAAGTLTSGNYRFIYVPGTLSVTAKPVSVTVTGAQNYGGAPAFGGKTGVSGLTVSGVSCSRLSDGQAITPTLQVGNTYAIDPASCSGGVLSNPNYTIGDYKSGGFSVFKVNLTVTADDLSRTYGFGNPALTHSFSGFQNDDDASDLGGAPALTTAALVKSNAGTYPIDIALGTLSSPNYRFVLKAGTLTVTKRELQVKADPATRTYGAADPAFTATFTGFRNGDTAAALSGAPAFSTTATASSVPGDYPLTVAQGTLSSPNYTFAGFAGSTLTITSGTVDIATTPVGGGNVSATVTYGAAKTPVVGSTITFTIGKGTVVACTAVTDATGKALCKPSALDNTKILIAGYTARFPGTAYLLPAEHHQALLG